MSLKQAREHFRKRIELERSRLNRGALSHQSDPDFREYFARVSPKYDYPEHLGQLTEALERARHEAVRVVITIPPRHGKTETGLHGIGYWLECNPSEECVFATYGQAFARNKSRKARDIASRSRIVMRGDAGAVDQWHTDAGGYLIATSVGGLLTGQGATKIWVDDPYKNRIDAESAAYRERVRDWFRDVVMTRVEPGGSVFVCMARWHPDDLAGELIREGWDAINFPAIDREGRALWPERWPVEALEKRKAEVGEFTWASLFQGEPRPRGGAVFVDVHTYDELPKFGVRFTVGVDLAYTSKTSSDYSVAVVMAHDAHRSYVVDVVRRQVSAAQFIEHLKKIRAAYPSATWRAYISGTEQGTADFFARDGVSIGAMPAGPRGDKFVRAQPLAAAWNAGRVLVPRESFPWLESTVAELLSFTGVRDSHDDIVDAMAAAFDAGAGSATGSVTTGGRHLESRDLGPRTVGARNLKW